MKNILVKSLYQLSSSNWTIKDRSNETDLYEKYVESHQISLGSFKKHLAGDWDYIFIHDRCNNIHQALHRTFFEIFRIWKEHAPCNILYTDPDTLAVAPINIWNRYNNFMMFNHSDPRSYYKINLYNLKFPNFFNAGVRYFPSSMSEKTWKIGLDLANNWDFNSYDTEQIILNQMLWSQGISLVDALNPSLNFHAPWMDAHSLWRQNLWNGMDINRSQIIHLHSSRGIDQKLTIIKELGDL